MACSIMFHIYDQEVSGCRPRVVIAVARMMEIIVVTTPKENSPIKAAFRRIDICTPHSMLMGTAITRQVRRTRHPLGARLDRKTYSCNL